MEYINLTDFFKLNIFLQKGDYLYKHDKDEHPLNDEFDISNLFFVTKSNNHNLTIHNMADSSILKIDLLSTNDLWWLLPLPLHIRKKIGLNNPEK
jgi:hypothetical protein